MPAFDKLQRASFDALDFPIKNIRISMESRSHQHIYLKTPGAAIEKQGRGLYRIEMTALFDANTKGYGQLWPQKLAALRERANSQVTAALVIPTLGTIQAWLPSWHQEADFAHARSGEIVPLSFLEDSNALTLSTALSVTQIASIETTGSAFATAAAKVSPQQEPGTATDFGGPARNKDIFSLIQEGVNDVLSIRDQADLFGNLVASKLDWLSNLLREADRTVSDFQKPENYAALNALHDLLYTVVSLQRDQEKARAPRIYRTPRLMSVSQISSAVYGDATHGVEIMQQNALEDPFSVPPNSQIIYYPIAA